MNTQKTVIMLSQPTEAGPFKPIFTEGLRLNVEAVPNYLEANEILGWEKFRVLDES